MAATSHRWLLSMWNMASVTENLSVIILANAVIDLVEWKKEKLYHKYQCGTGEDNMLIFDFKAWAAWIVSSWRPKLETEQCPSLFIVIHSKIRSPNIIERIKTLCLGRDNHSCDVWHVPRTFPYFSVSDSYCYRGMIINPILDIVKHPLYLLQGDRREAVKLPRSYDSVLFVPYFLVLILR